MISDDYKKVTVVLRNDQHAWLVKESKKMGLSTSALLRLFVLERMKSGKEINPQNIR